MSARRGILLAGGSGSRLHPVTAVTSKQLLPVYDKPMIYYPLTTLMLAGIREVMIVSTVRDQPRLQELFGSGNAWGMSFSYALQEQPNGIPEALIIASSFIGDGPAALILGDNLFYGHGLTGELAAASSDTTVATIFAYRVRDPERYGVVDLDPNGRPRALIEKPPLPPSHLAVTGLYMYPPGVAALAEQLAPSDRGELEITDLNRLYLELGLLRVRVLHRGYAWLDTGTPEALHQAASFVQTVQDRQGLQIASPEEIAWRMGYIDSSQLRDLVHRLGANHYAGYLRSLLDEGGRSV